MQRAGVRLGITDRHRDVADRDRCEPWRSIESDAAAGKQRSSGIEKDRW